MRLRWFIESLIKWFKVDEATAVAILQHMEDNNYPTDFSESSERTLKKHAKWAMEELGLL